MSSDEINQDELAQDAQNKEMLLEIFYKTKGNIDDINAAIDKKLFGTIFTINFLRKIIL